MVNCPHALALRIRVDGHELDLATASIEGFTRELDFRSGLLKRTFVWKLPDGKATRIAILRSVDMVNRERVHQRLEITPLNWTGKLSAGFPIVAEPVHQSRSKTYWGTEASGGQGDARWIASRTIRTRMPLLHRTGGRLAGPGTSYESAKPANPWDLAYDVDVQEGRTASFDRTWVGHSSRNPNETTAEAVASGTKLFRQVEGGFEAAAKKTREYWDAVWRDVDIAIDGDPVNQQGIRFSMFQLLQCYSGAVPGTNIGAKGLTGEAYNSSAFWDTETYCLPFYMFTNARAARGLLEYRTPPFLRRSSGPRPSTAPGVLSLLPHDRRHRELHALAALEPPAQPSTGVVFAVQHYTRVTGDRSFLEDKGLELVLQVSRFLASRVQYSERLRAYGYYSVMGPDEFQMMVNHNAYTNYMGKRSLEYALEALAAVRETSPGKAAALVERLGITADELATWQMIAEKMYIPRSAERRKLYEQHAGYFDLPHVDIHAIPETDFPLYHSWSYDRIYRNDMIKQPDVLMFMFLYNGSFSHEEKLANYLFYEPRTIHESSLSPSVHSILAIELGRYDEAYAFFEYATRIDLDDYNRNTREGLHTTALAAAWMNIVYGYAGLRSDG